MAVRPSWEGHLRLSLVTCPVALYPATSETETVRFNLINPATGNRIKMQTLDAGTGEEVSRGDLVKGYAVAKNEYVLLDKEDFERVKLESTRILDIEKFVARESIDRLYWDMPYHLVPSGKTGVEAYAVIREAMKKKGMVAIGRLVMSTRERICAIEIEASGLLMTTLRTAEEVRDVAQMPDVPLPKPDPQMLAIAEKIVDQQAGEFDPSEFVDRYEGALRELIEEKKRGHVPRARPAANDDGKVIDLMAALQRSLKASGGEGRVEQRPAAASRRREPARRSPASKPRPRRRGGSAA
jgi:DNA end-binding protein Ku